MALGPTPDNSAGAPSPRDHLAEFVNRNRYIPMWVHPDVADGLVRHLGRDGSIIVHPHPSTGHPSYEPTLNAQTGAVVTAGQQAGQQPPVNVGRRGQFGPAPPPTTLSGEIPPTQAGRAPLAGIPRRHRKSIFAGGTQGAGGPATTQPEKMPVFVQKGGAIDGRSGGKVPGKDLGRDTVHALLQPGEAVFNKKQLAGIKVKPGKEHLVRDDQKKAMSKAGKNAVRK